MLKQISPTITFSEKQCDQIELIQTNSTTGEIMNHHDIDNFEDLIYLGIVYFEIDRDGCREYYLTYFGRHFKEDLKESIFLTD